MPIYDYRCKTCQAVYEVRRSMSEADRPSTCPAGHVGADRLLPVFATTGSATAPAADGCVAAPGTCCGGACLTD